MNSMEDPKSQLDIEKLSKVLSNLNTLYHEKLDQLEDLRQEIGDLRNTINLLNEVLSKRSFSSASDLIQGSMVANTEENLEKLATHYFDGFPPSRHMSDSKLERKIYANEENSLICVLNFKDFKNVEIKFLNPQEREIQEASDSFLSIFIKGALLELKGNNPDIEVKYTHDNASGFIQKITISGVKSVEECDLIEDKIRELLSQEIELSE